MKSTINTYRSLMKDIELPAAVRKKVKDGLNEVAHNRQSPAAVSKRGQRLLLPSRRFIRRGLATACTLILVATLLFATGALPSFGTFNGSAPANANFFTLAAYASELNKDADQSATLQFKNFGIIGGWGCGTYDPETGESHEISTGGDGKSFAQMRYFLDLNCVGNNIETITYSIAGERIHFTSENKAFGPDDSMENNLNFQQQDSFTLNYKGQTIDKSKTQRLLVAYLPLNDRGNEIQQKLEDNNDSSKDENRLLSSTETAKLNNELEYNILHLFGKKISQSPLTLTATFSDGSTQTKSYIIAQADNFDQLYAEYQNQKSHSLSEVAPTLYTITETAK